MGVDSASAEPGADPAGPEATARIPAPRRPTERRPPGGPAAPRVPAPRQPDDHLRHAPATGRPGHDAPLERTVILPVVRPAGPRTPSGRSAVPPRPAAPGRRRTAGPDDTGLSRRARRAELAGPAVPGRRAALTVTTGGLVALVGFLAVPHLAAPGAGPLTVPGLVDRAVGYEPAVRLLWLVGAGAVLVALVGAVGAAVRRRWLRTVLAVVALVVTGVLSVGYLVVGVAALGPGGPVLAAGFAVVAGGLLLAFVGSIAALMTG